MAEEQMTAQEARLQSDLQRWAESGSATFDLGGALQRRQQVQRNRWRRWSSIAATLLLLSTTATVTFPAWASTAADWPIVGEPIKAYLAERAGLSWAYEMGFYRANLAELSDGGVTLRVLGVLADPIQTQVFYQIQGVNMAGRPAEVGDDAPEEAARLSITGIDGVGGVSSYFPISGFDTEDTYYVAETSPLQAEKAVLNLELQVGKTVKRLDLPVSRADSARFFTQMPVGLSQSHGPVSIRLEQLTLSPVEVIASLKTTRPPGPSMWTIRGQIPQPYLKVDSAEWTGRPVGPFVNDLSHIAFPRVTGKAQLVIPAEVAPGEVNARWDWAPGSVVDVKGVPVVLTSLEQTVQGLWVVWTYPAESTLQGLGGFTVIAKDGTRLPLQNPSTGVGGGPERARASVSVDLPPGFEPAAIEVSHALWRIDGPWVFDLPALPDKP